MAASNSDLRFDGRVAVVTGAGGGLGRAYALFLAERGAKVVVNDLGTSTSGDGSDSKAADKVVQEIRTRGGQAVSNYDSVEEGARIIKTAIDNFGRVDIVINNAGILRDTSFVKMTDRDFDLVYTVHLRGTYAVTKAAWPYMREQKYGRIVMVTSAAGLYGNFGQANYSAAKMGIVGLCNTLSLEGRKQNIFCNTVAPLAGSRMTETVMPPDFVKALSPEFVAPLVAFLSHDSCQETGGVFEVGAGWISKLRWQRSRGIALPPDASFNYQKVASHFDRTNDFSNAQYPTALQESIGTVMAHLQALPSSSSSGNEQKASSGSSKRRAGKSASVDVERAVSHQFESSTSSYTARDAALYYLTIGGAQDQLDPRELRYVYENFEDGMAVFPSFGVTVPGDVLMTALPSTPGLEFNPMMLLHGEQLLEVRAPLPAAATLVHQPRISGIYDKGKGALVQLDVTSTDKETGRELLFNRFSLFIRGIGGFGGEPQPKEASYAPPANTPPTAVCRDKTTPNQALSYRLTGDRNPLHIDPNMAAVGGFDKPILHGLCSMGFATRAVVQHFCDKNGDLLKSVKVRFSKHVFPGETLVTEMWRVAPDQIVFQCKVAERDEIVLSNAVAFLKTASGTSSASASASASGASSSGNSNSNSDSAVSRVFTQLKQQLESNPQVAQQLVKQVNGVFQFDIAEGGQTITWTIDLKSGSGRAFQGKADKPNCTMAMKVADFQQLMDGKLNPQNAFMQGKLKIGGDVMFAQKFGLVMAKMQGPKARL